MTPFTPTSNGNPDARSASPRLPVSGVMNLDPEASTSVGQTVAGGQRSPWRRQRWATVYGALETGPGRF